MAESYFSADKQSVNSTVPANLIMHSVQWFQEFLFNSNSSIQYRQFVCTLKWFQVLLCNTNNSSYIYPIEKALSCATSPGQSAPGIKGNERDTIFLKAS